MHTGLLLLIAVLCGQVSQPQPPAPSAPAPESSQPAPTSDPAKQPGIERLEPASRKLVEQQAANFIITQDGKFWDRQVWLKRQELREKMRKAAGQNAKPTDIERAHGASATAPIDPDDGGDGIEGGADGIYAYKGTRTNPPLWRAADGTVAVTSQEIAKARNGPKPRDPKSKPPESSAPSTEHEYSHTPFQQTVTPDELAEAIFQKKAELSVFKWSKRDIRKAHAADKTHPVAEPEEVEFVWRREALPVKWQSEPAKPTVK
jgi:hypothetical protein